jgi:hypothetical protein
MFTNIVFQKISISSFICSKHCTPTSFTSYIVQAMFKESAQVRSPLWGWATCQNITHIIPLELIIDCCLNMFSSSARRLHSHSEYALWYWNPFLLFATPWFHARTVEPEKQPLLCNTRTQQQNNGVVQPIYQQRLGKHVPTESTPQQHRGCFLCGPSSDRCCAMVR